MKKQDKQLKTNEISHTRTVITSAGQVVVIKVYASTLPESLKKEGSRACVANFYRQENV